MQILTKATVLALGILVSGTAMANDNFGGSPLYNQQYTHNPSQYYSPYPGYANYYGGYPYYPTYSGDYSYTTYGWYTGTPYSWPQPYWDPTITWHPYSKTDPNWIPYFGWR